MEARGEVGSPPQVWTVSNGQGICTSPTTLSRLQRRKRAKALRWAPRCSSSQSSGTVAWPNLAAHMSRSANIFCSKRASAQAQASERRSSDGLTTRSPNLRPKCLEETLDRRLIDVERQCDP